MVIGLGKGPPARGGPIVLRLREFPAAVAVQFSSNTEKIIEEN
jgi:hypothetical protein